MFEVLQELSATSKRTEKEQILNNLSDLDKKMFKFIAYLTYDPSVDFYVKEYNKDVEEHQDCITLYESLNDLKNIIATRTITGNMAKQWIEQQYEMLSEENAFVFAAVIARDLRIGMSATSINKVFPKTIYEHPYMRCSAFNEKNLKNITYPCYSQTKMDGLYCDIMIFDGKVEYRSRNGSYLDFNDEEVDKKLLEHYNRNVLMGEAIAVDDNGDLMDRSSSNGYLNSNDIDPNRIVFYLWDTVTLEEFVNKKCEWDYKERFCDLNTFVVGIIGPHTDKFKLVDTVECHNQNDIINHFRENRLNGEEGTVIKDKSCLWKPGTPKHQIKVKVVFECEMKAVDYKEGTGKNKGRLGAITFQSLDGDIEVSVGAGYKDSDRESLWVNIDQWIADGRIATIRANDVVQSESKPDKMSLFLPRFVEWRTDKDTADTKEQIIEQVKSFTDALNMIK